MHGSEDHVKLKEIYESIALSKDERTTACDFNLRELETERGLDFIEDGHEVLDVGFRELCRGMRAGGRPSQPLIEVMRSLPNQPESAVVAGDSSRGLRR